MRRKLRDMQAEYDGLSKAERENEFIGGKLLKSIKEQHDAVLGLEGSTGRMQRNVGNYQAAVENAIPAFGKFSGMMKTLGVDISDFGKNGSKAFSALGTSLKSFGKLFLTPPIAIIAVIIGAISFALGKLKEAFAKSDDAGTALASGLAALKPIGTLVSKIFESIALVLGKLVEGIGDFISGIGKAGAALGLWSKEAGNAAQAVQDLVKQQDRLEDTEREYTENSAKRNKEIAQLRDEAMKAGNPDERKKKLKQALDLEAENLKDEKRIAAERLDILEKQAKQNNDKSDEMKNKISEARAAMYKAEESYYTGTRRLQKEYLSASNEIEKEEKAKADEQRRKREEYLAKKREQAKTELDIERQLQDALLAAIKDENARAIAEAQIQGDREIAALQERLNTEKNLTAKAKEDLNALIVEKQRQLDEQIKTMAEEATKAREDEYVAQAQAAIDAENARHQALIEAKLANNEGDIELQKELMQLQFDAMLEQLDEQLQVELENKALSEEQKQVIEDEYRAIRAEKEKEFVNKLTAIDQQYADNQKLTIAQAKEQMSQSFTTMAKNASGAFGQISDLLAQYGEQNEDAAKASKAFAITQIITDQAISIADTAKAMAAAVAGAAEAAAATGPAAPFTLAAYIAEMVGLVIGAVGSLAASFVSAKSILSSDSGDAGSYATGGIIGGNDYSDGLTAHVSSGEMILNKSQQARLFDLANGQGGNLFDYSLMTDAMVAAVAAQPAPVMAYSEFKDFQSRTSTYDEFARI